MPALVTAIVLVVLVEAWTSGELRSLRSLGRRLRVFAPTWIALGGGVLLVLAVEAARGRSFSQVFGAYQGLTGSNYSIGPVMRWFGYHLAELDVYVGILPFAAFLVLVAEAVRRGLSRPLLAFAAVSLSLVFWLTIVVAAFIAHLAEQDGVGRIEERYLFYLAPLLLIALLVWVDGHLPRRWPVWAGAALVAGLLPVVIPYTKLVNLGALSDTFVFIPLWRLVFYGTLGFGTLKLFVTVCALAGAALLLILPRRLALLAPLLVLGYFYAVQRPLEQQIATTSAGVVGSAITVRREWIDENVRDPNAQVAAVETTASNPRVVPEDEFFNRRLRPIYQIGPVAPGGAHLPARSATVDPRTGVLKDYRGAPIETSYAFADGTLALRGDPVASDPGVGAVVYRVHGALALAEQVAGIFPDGWTAPTVTYTRFHCRGGRLVLGLATEVGVVKGRQHVVATAGGRTVAATVIAPGTSKAFAVPLRPNSGRCDLTLAISPTYVPAQVFKTPDARDLGVLVTSRAYKPPP